MPVALPADEDFRAEHYLARAEWRGECLCIGDGRRYPTWGRPGPERSKTEHISHLICRVTYGKRPHKRSVVMHSCDNMACIRPEHLRWGTQKENIHDAMSKGRASKPPPFDHRKRLLNGNHHAATLKPDDVVAIRARISAGERHARIAADYGISFQQVSKIKLGQRWGWQ